MALLRYFSVLLISGSLPCSALCQSIPSDVANLNGFRFANQFGDKATKGIAGAVSDCGIVTACLVVVPGSYAMTERVPGSWNTNIGGFNAGTTRANVQVFDYRQGDYQTAINQ